MLGKIIRLQVPDVITKEANDELLRISRGRLFHTELSASLKHLDWQSRWKLVALTATTAALLNDPGQVVHTCASRASSSIISYSVNKHTR